MKLLSLEAADSLTSHLTQVNLFGLSYLVVSPRTNQLLYFSNVWKQVVLSLDLQTWQLLRSVCVDTAFAALRETI